jgi:hypothetical protein
MRKRLSWHSTRGVRFAPLLFTLAACPLAGQIWNEEVDAGSFPDKTAQRTFDPYHLAGLTGATDEPSGDLRDAYCIRIADPAAFRATTDPAVDPTASGAFDTRLFLFTPAGTPVLANDNTSGATVLSTLTGVATDGSGFVLERPGEYVLVVAGGEDAALDRDLTEIFAMDSDPSGVLAWQPAAGAFHHWSAETPEGGAYTVAVRGAETCGAVDLILGDTGGNEVCLSKRAGGVNFCEAIHEDGQHTTEMVLGDANGDGYEDLFLAEGGHLYYCLGDGGGGFAPCVRVTPANLFGEDVDVGDLNGDGHLDAVFALSAGGGNGDQDIVCLGDGQANFTCSDLDSDTEDTNAVALGYVDGDRHLDAVLGKASNSLPDQVCLGDGTGLFQCENLDGVTVLTSDVALADFDNDGDIDVVLAYPISSRPKRYCRGDGVGGFSQCVDVGSDVYTETVALGDVNEDGELDIVASDGEICRGDGTGNFSCAPDLPAGGFLADLDLGDLNSDGHLDVVRALFNGKARYFPGDGTGVFGPFTEVEPEDEALRCIALGVVGVDVTFEDGFESGDTSGWSLVVIE